ncbi:hypothetical protein KZZ52_33090 [Dactylosporangium sp. AC04546]|uniref:WXG100 family type VII secretion target n=1 Tax=Dactylosporangium sp. AC04546 TaxID=2862460 RepID=UPI001EDD75D0|nr:hypothetical protein [Dactylosporangium sp. AC04546]WVK78821.1 hypothetical protein KZZ52_33090 [Dactylosporangium sp. AC04546]
MSLGVDVAGLRRAADGYVRYGSEFGEVAANSIPKCSLPWSAIPAVDFGFGDAYKAAYEALDLSARTLSGTLGTIGLALTRVANHYEDNEAANTRMFQGRPITAPPAPQARPMDTGLSDGDYDRVYLGGFASAGLIILAGQRMFAAAGPFGLPMLGLGLPLLTSAVLNLRDPIPYFDAQAGWGEVGEVLNDAASRAPQLCYDVVYRGNWQGTGKDAFYACVNNDIQPSLGAMKDLNNTMQLACITGGVALGTSLAAFIAATLTATGFCAAATAAAAASAGTATPAAQAAVTITISQWAIFTLELLAEVAAVFGGMALTSAQIGQSYDSLKAFLGGKNNQLEAGSLQLRPAEVTAISDWELGWKEPS